MKSTVASDFLSEIDNTIQTIESFNIQYALEQSYLAKFLVVFICGLYEEITENILGEWASKKSHPKVAQFIINYLDDKFRNPETKKVIEILSMFDEKWGEEIDNMASVNTSALDAIVSNKNAIAHGRPCTITLPQVKEFYNRSKKVIEKIDDMVL